MVYLLRLIVQNKPLPFGFLPELANTSEAIRHDRQNREKKYSSFPLFLFLFPFTFLLLLTDKEQLIADMRSDPIVGNMKITI